MPPETYLYDRYLDAKRTVDDRALNHRVWRAFVDSISGDQGSKPKRVLEVACGTGSMIDRIHRRCPQVLADLHYMAIDKNLANVQRTRERARELGLAGRVEVHHGDVFEWLEGSTEPFDGLIACAFLDLVDLGRSLPVLAASITDGGFAYLPIHFDGTTVFEPVVEAEFDRRVLEIYHSTMDNRVVADRPSGDSKTGRHLFSRLPACGLEILEAGASDWLVFPGQGAYQYDEGYFLHYLVDTVRGAVSESGCLLAEEVSQFEGWVETRHRQVEQAELVLVVHQLDFFATKPSKGLLKNPERPRQRTLHSVVSREEPKPAL